MLEYLDFWYSYLNKDNFKFASSINRTALRIQLDFYHELRSRSVHVAKGFQECVVSGVKHIIIILISMSNILSIIAKATLYLAYQKHSSSDWNEVDSHSGKKSWAECNSSHVKKAC